MRLSIEAVDYTSLASLLCFAMFALLFALSSFFPPLSKIMVSKFLTLCPQNWSSKFQSCVSQWRISHTNYPLLHHAIPCQLKLQSNPTPQHTSIQFQSLLRSTWRCATSGSVLRSCLPYSSDISTALKINRQEARKYIAQMRKHERSTEQQIDRQISYTHQGCARRVVIQIPKSSEPELLLRTPVGIKSAYPKYDR